MVFFKHLIESLVNPYVLILFAFAFLLIKFYQKTNFSRFFWSFFLIFISLIVLSTGWIAQALTEQLETQYTIANKLDRNIRWIVVFSGGQSKNQIMPASMLLTSASIKRLIEGIRLYHQLPGAKLLLSGGGYAVKIAEANRLNTLAKWFGMSDSDIVLETTSINTAEQAKNIKQLVKDRPFYLVTSAIHMRRAMRLCQMQGLHPIAAPTDFTWQDARWNKIPLPNPQNLVYISIALHEILGMWWSQLTGEM